MATTGQGQNKSAFLRDLLGRKPDLNLGQATEAWQKAGNEGDVSSSLFYNVKRAVGEGAGGTGEGGEAPRKPKAKAAAKGPRNRQATQAAGETRTETAGEPAPTNAGGRSRSGERERVLDRVEDRIDDLIGELKQLGGLEDALEALRKARRVVVRSHQG